ncbi:hypothetical protein [Enterococcus sp. CWB-B31]|uniref:hypothetical protein n=1 Tax=Enterococcus sp. CWB-B31 TaxID=2885159 RepID=UPI001E5B59A1|nr:hypothetical protein [Enterococcus sp. CWB-B31]MCB5955090.1 hypothetical protein [Enterococcus sp. CWB-B31]
MMIYSKKAHKNRLTDNKKSILAIILVSFIFIIPQLITKNMVVSSDTIFHFNRFFDTSEQIRSGNFEYFISLYGFQQSGRIVNAFYSPLIAYLQGSLVLISKNWFFYQVLSNLILFIVSGCNMYVFLLRGHLNQKKSCVGAILYMCTYSVLYWSTRQGFSSWGAAIMPLCLTIIFESLEENKVPKFKLGFFTALLFQIHILSAFILILIYIPVFISVFIKSDSKLQFLLAIFKEVILFLLLTLNVWATYYTITQGNKLIAPFVNHTMSLNTINRNSYYWILNPISLVLILMTVLGVTLIKWKTYTFEKRLLFLIMLFFLVLSTSIIPWSYLIEQDISIAKLIQFPFRFFVPVTIISIYLFLQFSNSNKLNSLFALVGIFQVVILMFVSLNPWNGDENYTSSGPKTIMTTSNDQSIKASFYSKDKEEALKLVQKTTPDYLPSYGENVTDTYKLYGNKIIYANEFFEKSIEKSKLIITMKESNKESIEFPIIIYTNTILSTNGKKLSKSNYVLSEIGTPIINKDYLKNNQVEIEFNHESLDMFIYLTIILWIISLLKSLYDLYEH